MSDPKLIASYRDGLHKISVYTDRVELGIFLLSSYSIEEIKSAEVSSSFFGCQIQLALRGGQTSDSVMLSKADVKACQNEIAKLVRNFEESSDLPVGDSILCTVLGGTGSALAKGDKYVAVFGQDAIYLVSGAQRFEVKLEQLTALKIEGPGRITSDAGVMGGGFGLEGAALGIGVAALINTLTTKSETNTILYIAWPGAELFLHTSSYTPDEARLILSHTFSAIQSVANVGRADLASQLERIGELRDSGKLTAEEYGLAKAKLLGGS